MCAFNIYIFVILVEFFHTINELGVCFGQPLIVQPHFSDKLVFTACKNPTGNKSIQVVLFILTRPPVVVSVLWV